MLQNRPSHCAARQKQSRQSNVSTLKSQSKPLLTQVSGEKEFFANLVVDAVSVLDPQTLDLRMIGVKKARTFSSNYLG